MSKLHGNISGVDIELKIRKISLYEPRFGRVSFSIEIDLKSKNLTLSTTDGHANKIVETDLQIS